MEARAAAQRPITDQLKSIGETLTEWEQEKNKIIAQLKSLSNLQEQLGAVHRCKSKGNIGILKDFPRAVNCLEGKILASQERALAFIERDRKSMSRLSSVVQNKVKKLEVLIQDEIGRSEVELTTHRTAERFSLCDYLSWADEIRHIVHTDWSKMRSQLMRVTDGGVGRDAITETRDTWEQGGARLEEFHQLIHYVTGSFIKK